MMLFQPEHIRMNRQGLKTETRRMWKRPRVRLGAIHQQKTRLFGRSQGHIQINALRRERLLDITEEGAKREGGYTRASYLKKWFEINPESPPNPLVYVVGYYYVRL